MKKYFIIFVSVILSLILCFASACAGDTQNTNHQNVIEVSWSDGVEGVVFMQGDDRLLPKNGKITTESDQDIHIEVSLQQGYRHNQPVLKVDGVVSNNYVVPVSARSIEVTATPNTDISLILGEGVGYRLDELCKVEEDVGYTSVIGIYLEEGYREISAPKVNLIVVGAEYEAVASLNEWQLDAAQLKNDGYHSFYKVRVLENTTIGVTGVVADSNSAEEYATVTHVGGEGYTLRALIDTNNDGISDTEQVLSGSFKVVKDTTLNVVIRRDSSYTTANAKLFANGTEIIGTQGEGADNSDPLSNELIYCIKVEGDMELTVTGVKMLGQFVVHIMNTDGTQRYRTFCRADNLSEALAQIPGNDARENEAYERWWEPNPGEGYTFRYWHFVEHEFEEVTISYVPELYEDVYCGYIEDGTIPTDPMDRPTIPSTPETPKVPDDVVLPDSLRAALEKVTSLSQDDKESKQWVLAWAAYQLYKAEVVDLGRPAVFGYDNILDAWYDDIIMDATGVSVNDIWVYAYDMIKTGASEIDVTALATDYLLKGSAGSYTTRAANKEAYYIEIVSLLPEYETKTSYSVQDNDMDINMTIVLILDRLGIDWSLGYGNSVSSFTKETFREYTKENAANQVMANVIKEVFDYIDSINA